MAVEPYEILEIQPEQVLEPEALGSKQKFWCRPVEGQPGWLFKFPQPNTGQHWAEKIAAEIVACLEILHARVELAVFQTSRLLPLSPSGAMGANSTTATRCSPARS